LLSAAFAALVAIFGRIGVRDVDSTFATALRAFVMAAMLGVVCLFLGKYQRLDAVPARSLLFILLSGGAGAASWICYFMALKSAPTTTAVAALDRASIALVFLFAVAFLGEPLQWRSAAGAVLVTAGAVLMVI
jgi:transporter family protein